MNFSATLQSENTALCKELTFKYFASSKSVIIMVCRDISEIVLSERDTLTGLYNSSGFHKRAARWISENPGRKFRIQRYNIDRFRDINGIYGYDVGNKLLRDIANYMQRFNTAALFINGEQIKQLSAQVGAPNGLCYLHLQTAYAEGDCAGSLIKQLDFSSD